MTSRLQTIRLMQGACISRMKTMKEGSVGCVVTDPPYL